MGNHPSKPIDFKIIADYVCIEESDYIISVGSGCGEIEDYIERERNKTIICIDPNPESSIGKNYHQKTNSSVVKPPNYPTLDNFLNEVDIKNKKITLMIIWSTPRGYDYDIEAISKLNPENIIILYDVTGSAGSRYLHHWLAPIKNDYGLLDTSDPCPHRFYKPKTYHLISEYTHLGEHVTYTLLYLSREAVKKELSHGVYKYL